MANWQGITTFATKQQLLSSINGLYIDIQDINLSSITVTDLFVSTLTAEKYISTPELYVSSIIGGGLAVNNGLLQISTGDFSLLSLSSLSLKGFDFGGLDISFDLGLGDAIGGLLGGLGAAVGGALIGVGTGAGLAISGAEQGIATLIAGRPQNFISQTEYETVNFTSQLQISTLGNAYPVYSSIFRTVSSISANTVPGKEQFVSTFFSPGTTCIRSVSDPFNLITGDSNLNTSTIQSFGQWVPFIDPTPTGEDIFARKAQFSSMTLSNVNSADYPIIINMSNTNGLQQILSLIDTPPDVVSENIPYSDGAYAYSQIETPFQHRTNFNRTIDYISTPYNQYTSSIGNYVGGVFFLTSSITNQSTIPLITYVGNILGGADFAVCEPDETGFLSTYTMDIVAQSSNVLLQWGLAIDNLNSTIAVGTGKRISWDIPNNTSNFIDIPVPQSTIISYALAGLQLEQSPYEARWLGQYTYNGSLPINPNGGMAFAMRQMTFGDTTVFNNIPGYPYQFNGNVFVDGILEADQIIALSSFVSTNIVNFFSTVVLDADEANIEYCQVSTLYSTDLIGGNSISSFGIEVYNSLSQFSFVSTLVVDFQIFEGNNTGIVTTNLNNIQGTLPTSRINMERGTFTNLSTINHSTTNLFANSATLNTLSSSNGSFSTLSCSNGSFSTLSCSNGSFSILSSSNGSFSNLTTSNVFNGNTMFGQILTLSSITTSTINVNTISLLNVNFSTITIPNLNYSSFVFNSTTFTNDNEQPDRYIFPTNGYGRVIATSLFPTPTLSTSGFTTITNPIVLPFNDKMCRVDVTCSLANANRSVKAGISAFVNGAQGVSRTLYANENPADFIYNPQVSLIIDPRIYGVINTLDLRFFLSGAPNVGEFALLDAVYYSLM